MKSKNARINIAKTMALITTACVFLIVCVGIMSGFTKQILIVGLSSLSCCALTWVAYHIIKNSK